MRKSSGKGHAHSGCEVWQQDFLKLDLPDNHFDGVFANAVLFHIPSQELPRVLLELKASLKPGGVLFSSNPRGHNEEGWSQGRYGEYRGASNLAGRSKCVNQEATKVIARAKRIAGGLGVPSCSESRRRPCRHRSSGLAMIELPGVIESGMPRRNGGESPEPPAGRPRRSRTAKALPISRRAVKSRCAGADGVG
jgi:SAM-dependent methyltransferase